MAPETQVMAKEEKKQEEAIPGTTWQVLDWNHDVELLEGIQFNIANCLKKEGTELPEEED